MLKSFLRKYLGITEQPTIQIRDLAQKLEANEWFQRYLAEGIEEQVIKRLTQYRYEGNASASDTAKEAVKFLKEEAFIDSIVERIKKKQL